LTVLNKTSFLTWLFGLIIASATIKSKFDNISLTVMTFCVIQLRSIPCKLTFGVSCLNKLSSLTKIFCAGSVRLQSPPWFKNAISFWLESLLSSSFPAFQLLKLPWLVDCPCCWALHVFCTVYVAHILQGIVDQLSLFLVDYG